MAFNLKLPDERGKQLQMIAEAEGKSVVDVITDHIRSKVDAGVIPADLPYTAVTKTMNSVIVEFPGFEGEVPFQEVSALVFALRGAGEKFSPADVERKQKLMEALSSLSGVKVKRMAQGVKLVSPNTGEEYPIAFGVASDLASQIERGAKR
ncbi:hypothetical protein [Roseinatronobacter sp.]|uniref:hypothetical protein n=1 Tax=Roseinatronobacter sp. TaxID=1945755 RepID=UPI003F72832B